MEWENFLQKLISEGDVLSFNFVRKSYTYLWPSSFCDHVTYFFFLFKHILLLKFALREKNLIERGHLEITLN